MVKLLKENKVVRILFGCFVFISVVGIISWLSFIKAETITLNRIIGNLNKNNSKENIYETTYQPNNVDNLLINDRTMISERESDEKNINNSESVISHIVLSEMLVPENIKLENNFGWIRDKELGYWHFNPSITLMNTEEINVIAAFDGFVSEIYFDEKEQGFSVRISHAGGLETVYSHLDRLNTREGMFIESGTLIGCAGKNIKINGEEYDSYYYMFEFYQDDNAIDPSPYIKIL